MLAKFEAADPSCVDGPEDPRRKAEIMAAVKNHFSSPCRRMPPGKVPKIGMFTVYLQTVHRLSALVFTRRGAQLV